ncbi:hypothetical protein ALC57_00414, partial [Trachymyrmex cornetzi]
KGRRRKGDNIARTGLELEGWQRREMEGGFRFEELEKRDREIQKEERWDAINFLDTTIMFRNDGLIFDWYRKPTFSGRFLNYWSQHPISQKKGTILSLIDKVFFVSHPHDFDWENVKILDSERNYNKRIMSEMLYINCQTNGLNMQTDTEALNHGYIEILNKL